MQVDVAMASSRLPLTRNDHAPEVRAAGLLATRPDNASRSSYKPWRGNDRRAVGDGAGDVVGRRGHEGQAGQRDVQEEEGGGDPSRGNGSGRRQTGVSVENSRSSLRENGTPRGSHGTTSDPIVRGSPMWGTPCRGGSASYL